MDEAPLHELTSIGGADTGLLALLRKKIFPLRHKEFPPQEICELVPLRKNLFLAFPRILWYSYSSVRNFQI